MQNKKYANLFYNTIMLSSKNEAGKMDWMYNERPDKEDYLLGKKVDRHVDEEEKLEPPSSELCSLVRHAQNTTT